jgi:hypothetical protein
MFWGARRRVSTFADHEETQGRIMIATASFSSGFTLGLGIGFIAGGAFFLGMLWLVFKLISIAYYSNP